MPMESTSLRPAVFHILLALARRDLHGLGIAEAVDDATDGTVQLGPGTLYRSLKEMSRDGLITDVPAPSDQEDPRRRFYAITAAGRAAAEVEARRLARVVEVARENRVLPETPG
jgi:DNA-binding PadR family transcriptional regulator